MSTSDEQLEKARRIRFRRYLILFLFLCSLTVLLPILFTGYAQWPRVGFSQETGVVGDTIGGTMGPFVAMIGGFLTFLAFWEQYKANEQQKREITRQKDQAELENFESTFFELVRLHRENVAELNYSKSDGDSISRSDGRKVIKVILQEFIECYKETTKYFRNKDIGFFVLEKHQVKLNKIKQQNGLIANIKQMAIIDIAYSIVFFGLQPDGEAVVKKRFQGRFDDSEINQLIFYLKLKPKREISDAFKNWERMATLTATELRTLIDRIYDVRHKHSNRSELSGFQERLLGNKDLNKYYGGHHLRLGHYFRHLFQTYKFLDSRTYLKQPQKYFYGKTLRAQLSTYEQLALFINAISSLGSKWEYLPEQEIEKAIDADAAEDGSQGKLISYYDLVKNLPGYSVVDIHFKRYFPRVKFEIDE